MYAKGSISSAGAKARALELLAATPTGLHSKQFSDALGISEARANAVMSQLGKAALVVGVLDPLGKATQRRRWCLQQHEAACRAAVDASRKPRKKPKLSPKLVGDGAVTAKTKITICPAGKDHRHTVQPEEVAPFFSGMKPGQYMPADTWGARAYDN